MKRIAALLLTIFMMISILCACDESTDESNKGAPGTASAKELMSKIHYTYTREKNGTTKEEEMVIDIKWTENGATVEGWQDTEEGRYEMTMELTLDDQKRPVSMIQTETNLEGEVSRYSIVLAYEKERQIKRTVTDEEGHTSVATYDFDENGRLIREEHDGGSVRTYEYDAWGNCTLERYQYADSEEAREYRTAYTYDDAGKAVFATRTYSSDGQQTQTHYYHYPNGNVMMEMKISNRGDVNFNFLPNNPKDGMSWGYGSAVGSTLDWEYTAETDANGYYTKIIRTNTQTGKSQTATMEYDQNGNLAKHTNFYDETKLWEYDSRNRLVKYTHGRYVTVYAYDDQGRLISEKRTTADGESDTQTWVYNEAGMTVKRTENDVYIDGEGALEQIMEIEYIENSNCPISDDWANFFLANLFDVT